MQDRVKILLVEDDDIDILAFERAVKRGNLDYDVTVNHHIEEVLNLASENDFTCIFLDYLLPGSDGLEILKKIRGRGVQTPVVIVTSQGNEKIAVEMMKSGALDYITKEEITAERISMLVHTATLLLKSEKEKVQAEASLRESQQMMANIFDSSGVGMLLIDDLGLVLRANKAFADIAGKTINNIVGHPVDELFGHRLQMADLLKNSDGTYEFSAAINGVTKYLSVTYSFFKDEGGSDYIIINFNDVTAKVSYEQQIVLQNTRMEALFESTNSVIFSIDEKNRITGYNRAASKIFKTFYNLEIKEAMDVYQIPFDDDNRRMMRESFETAFSGKRITVVHRINKLFFETTFSPIKTDDKRSLGVSVFSKDISQEKNNETKLIEAKKEAEELAKAKSQFLSNMSHEIRTPMNAIIGLTSLLLDTELTEVQRENLNTLKFSADNLLVIINDILDLSKIESGKITFEEINIDCKKIIEQVAKTFIIQSKNNNVVLKTEFDPNIPAQLMGDPYRLTQILNNLVGNAVKFTSEGSVTIAAKSIGLSGNGKQVLEFKVSDTGIGIHKDKLGAIFETFTQAYTDTTRKFGGTGLGLAITKQLIEVQGGEIWVTSEPGLGTAFTFTLPLKDGNVDWVNVHKAKNVPDSALEGLRVAVAEDNKANQLVIRQILSRWKINVVLLNNGREAIEYLEKETPDIVFMDLQMPEVSGFDAVEVIRDENSAVLTHNVPVLALTADVFPETRDRIYQTGMNDYLLKPINIEELKEKLIYYGVLKETLRMV
jgi:PAS domain S-box-containing protein